MKKLGLGKNHKQEYQVIISLPRSLVELKDHCRLHKVMELKEEDFKYAMAHGLPSLIAKGLVELVKDEEKVHVPEPKASPPAPKKEDIVIPANTEADKPIRDILAEQEVVRDAIPEILSEEPIEHAPRDEKKSKKSKKNKE